MRSNIEGARISDCLYTGSNRFGHTLFTSTGTDIALDADMPPFIEAQLSAAASMLLPAAVAAIKGLAYRILNNSTAALVLTVKTSTGGAIVGSGATSTVRQGTFAEFITNGSVWKSNAPTAT